MEISNNYSLNEINEKYKIILKNLESELLLVRAIVVLLNKRDFDRIQTKFVNIPMAIQN